MTPAEQALEAAEAALADAIERGEPEGGLYDLDRATIRAELAVSDERARGGVMSAGFDAAEFPGELTGEEELTGPWRIRRYRIILDGIDLPPSLLQSPHDDR